MNAMQDIAHVVTQAVSAHLSEGRVHRITTEPYLNSVDEEGLRITLLIADDDDLPTDGDTMLKTLLEVSDRLTEAGESRVPTLKLVTEEEMAHDGDPDA